MRTVILSFSHHGNGMGRRARELGHEVVGAFDHGEAERAKMAESYGCPVFDNPIECLEATRPDVALVSGRHTLAPSYLQACLDVGVPYLFDKPWADCANRMRPAAEASEAANHWGTPTLPNEEMNVNDVLRKVRADGTFGELVHFYCRLSTATPARYDDTPSAWHNDPSISGGGCWAIECQHGIGTLLDFAGDQPIAAVAGVLSNATHKRPFEDYAAGLFRIGDGATALIEATYHAPLGDNATGDYVIRAIGTKATVVSHYGSDYEPEVQIHRGEGSTRVDEVPRSDLFGINIQRNLDALAAGNPPPSPIGKAVRILELQDAVYDLARSSAATNGPHPMADPAPRPT